MLCSYDAALILKVLPGPPQRVQSYQNPRHQLAFSSISGPVVTPAH
jgi:hypothetical protein